MACTVPVAPAVFDNTDTSEKAIIAKIKELGYGARIGTPDVLASNRLEVARAKRNFLVSLILTLPLMILSMSTMFRGETLFAVGVEGLIQAALAAVVLFYAGRSVFVDAFTQTRHLRANMNSLIALGTLTAFGWSVYALTHFLTSGTGEHLYFESSAMIIMLILLGRFFEARAKGKAGEAIEALLKLQPSKTLAVINGIEVEIDVSSVRPGMTLLVRPGERIPADGKVIDGSPIVDESILTGESVPVEKSAGHEVIGGALNGNISFRMEVTHSSEESFLASIIRLVSEAQTQKAPVQKIADRVASVFVPIVIAVAAVTFGAWYVFDSSSPMLIRSVISVLIIACPCALGLATPTAILAGTGRAARDGIIIRGADILENLTRVDTVLFDKTGTLTYGKLDVLHVKTFGDITEHRLLRLVGAIESHSEHPVGEAIVKYTRHNQIELASVRNVETLPGLGLKGDVGGRLLVAGNPSLMAKEEIDLSEAKALGDQEMQKGQTVIYVALDGQVKGLVVLADRIRSEATETVARLKAIMSKVSMISGDNRKTAAGVAGLVGLDDFEAEILPQQKKYMVESYRKSGFNVVMVGDGINDAPALAMANRYRYCH
jgi:Cu+-exporting ATPase